MSVQISRVELETHSASCTRDMRDICIVEVNTRHIPRVDLDLFVHLGHPMRCPCNLPFVARRFSTKPPPVVLRPYQETCLQACTEALESGATRIGVSLPTGSGKTTVFITLLSLIHPPPEHRKATRSLVIVNSIELARQAAAQTERLFPGWSVEIEQGAKYKASGKADLYVYLLCSHANCSCKLSY